MNNIQYTSETELEDNLAAYAMNALEPEEKAALEVILESSEEAQAKLAEFQEWAATLSEDVHNFQPPDYLRSRILEQATLQDISTPTVQPVPVYTAAPRENLGVLQQIWASVQGWFTLNRAIYAGGAAAIVALIAFSATILLENSRLNNDMTTFNSAPITAGALSSFQAESSTSINEPILIIVPMISDQENITDTRALFTSQPDEPKFSAIFTNFPKLPIGEGFTIWGERQNKMEMLGRFTVNEQGNARIIRNIPRPLTEYDRVVVTQSNGENRSELDKP